MAQINKSRLWVSLLVTAALSLAACMPVAPESTATPPATEEATEEPTEEATAQAAEEATAEPASEGTDIGALVRQILAQQLQLNLEQIEVISVQDVEWPDACLGVYTADMMCAQVITPGFRVVLAVDGAQYEYHTNIDGSFVQLFAAPEANVGDVLISWQQTLDTCQSLQIGTKGLVFGACMGVQMGGKFGSPERESELADLTATFAPFEAETATGVVTFNGQGSAAATPAEQRMIAEWMGMIAQEAAAGHADASWGLAFAWHREGGIAGFCDDLTAFVTGQLDASTCKGETAENLGQRRLTAEELEQLYAWVDEYAPFEYIQDDGAVADSMKVTLIFSGAGSIAADTATQEAIVLFAQELYSGMGQ